MPVPARAASNSASRAATAADGIRWRRPLRDVEPAGPLAPRCRRRRRRRRRRRLRCRPDRTREPGRRRPLVHERGEPGPQRAELELGEGEAGLLGVPASEGQLVDVDVEGDVADQRDHLGVLPHLVGVRREVLPQLRERASRCAKRASRSPYSLISLAAVFSPTPGTPGRLSDGSPRSAASNGYFVGRTPVRSSMPGLVVEGVVADPSAVVEHPDVGVLDQLVRVAVTGHDDHRVPAVAGLGGQRGQHVVGLESLGTRSPGWPGTRGPRGSGRTAGGGRRGVSVRPAL